MDFSLAVPFDDCVGYVVKALRAPGASIKYAGHGRIVEKPQIDVADVIDIDEVTQLLAIFVAIRT